MPGSTCLHIQDRESGPIRVVELPWISVRIGRAAYCEVRLPAPDLPDEVCRLTRRGRTWCLVPTTSSSSTVPILLDGRPIEGSCPLAFDVPVVVGPFCLTLRNDVSAEPEWEVFPASTTFAVPEPPLTPIVELRPFSPAATAPDPRPTVASPERSTAAPDPDRWRARWKAAESHLKARTNRPESHGHRPPTASPPTPSYREPDRPVAPPTPRTVPPSSPSQTRPAWTTPRPGPIPTVGRPKEHVRPVPFEPAAYQPPEFPAADPGPTRPLVEPPAFATEPLRDPPSPPGFDRVEVAPVPPSAAHEPAPIDDPAPAGELPAPDQHAAIDEPSLAQEPTLIDQPAAIDEPVISAESAQPLASAPVAEVAPPRPSTRAPRRRRPRERMGSGRRGDPPRRLRSEPAPPGAGGDRRRDSEPADVELPSAREILENHKNSPGPRPAASWSKRGKGPVPTVPTEPAHWDLPAWLALPPVGAFMLSVGAICCLLGWWWVRDAQNAAVVSSRLLASDSQGRARPLPPDVLPPGGQWIRTTSQHMANWAIYSAGAEEDPTAGQVATLVTKALEISPLNPTARLAMTQIEGPGADVPGRIRGLGLSRDSVSLAWSARRLMDSGKKQAALRLYHRAIKTAAGGGLSRSAIPRFAEDEGGRRYYLPAEDAIRDILTELAGHDGLPFQEWSTALPRHPTVLLATARLLRDRGDAQADSLLDELLNDRSTGEPPDARRLAARAEALALRSRWDEASEQYRQAIEAVDNDLIRRSWWFNLADLADRLNDEGQRQAAFRAVLAARNSDDISRRVGLIKGSGSSRARARETYGTYRAN